MSLRRKLNLFILGNLKLIEGRCCFSKKEKKGRRRRRKKIERDGFGLRVCECMILLSVAAYGIYVCVAVGQRPALFFFPSLFPRPRRTRHAQSYPDNPIQFGSDSITYQLPKTNMGFEAQKTVRSAFVRSFLSSALSSWAEN